MLPRPIKPIKIFFILPTSILYPKNN